MYKAGIIGLGKIAVERDDCHMTAYRDCPDTKLAALCDTNEDLLSSWHSVVRNDAKLFTDYRRMVTGNWLDIVSVCTPVESHCQIVCDIAPYVKAIYCEKPIAPTIEEADKMIETCHKYGVILQVNHQRLFMRPVFKFSRGYINTGTHLFSLINHLFRDGIEIETEYIDTGEPIFELDCTHNKERMILKGVEHLIECIKEGKQSVSNGESAREALADCLDYIKDNTAIVKIGKRRRTWLKVVPFKL